MKLKFIRLLLLSTAVVLLTAACGGDAEPTQDSEPTTAAPIPTPTPTPTPLSPVPTPTPSSTSDYKAGEESVILGQTRYDIECIDNELGMDRANEIFNDKAKMTSEEIDKVGHCTVGSSEEADATSETTEERGLTATPSSTSDYKAGEESVILGQTRYDIECIDNELGMDRANEIFNDKAKMTSEEIDKVGHCTVGSSEEADATSKTNEKNQGNGGIPRPKVWTPSPSQTDCLFSAIGAKGFREIRQGDRLATAAEVKAAEPCLAGVAGSPSLNSLPHPLGTEQCPSLETLEQNLKEYRPRWDQLECHMKGLKRSPIPSFSTNASIGPVVVRARQGVGSRPKIPEVVANVWRGDLDDLLDSMVAESWEQYAEALYDHWYRDVFKSLLFSEAEFPSANASMISMTVFPPYIDEFYNLVHYPPTDYWHDELLRSFAVHILQRKQTGDITYIGNLYPPLLEEGKRVVAPAKNQEEFRVWTDEVFIPQKVHEAKMAEALKVEILHPWPAEADVWVMGQPWAANASDQELLDAGQYLLDAVATAVRPYFKGQLVVTSFTPGQGQHPIRPLPFWKDLSYESVDRVDFTFYMRCDEQTTTTELREYMDDVMHIVKRDSVAWTIGELSIDFPAYEICGTDLNDQADEIYSAVLDILFEQEIPPVGMAGIGNVFSHDHKVVLEEKLFSRSAD